MGRRETWPWRNKRQRTCVKSRKSCPASLGIELQTLVSTSPSIVHVEPSEEDSAQRPLNSSNTDMEDLHVTSMGILVGAEIGPGEVPSKGVRKRGTKWVAEIRNRHLKGGRNPGRKWLGTFSTAAEAREAYAVAAKKIKSSECQKASKSSKSLLERAKKARKYIQMHFDNDMVGYGSCTTEDLAFGQDPLNSVDFPEMKNRSSSEQEALKGAAVIQSASECSFDFARKNLPTPKCRTDVRKSKQLKHVHTSSADSLHSSYKDQASTSRSAAAASPTASRRPMSSSATSRRVKNTAVKNKERASSREAFCRRKKAVPKACHAHVHGPFERAPEESQTPRKADDNVHVEPTRVTDVRGVSTDTTRSYRSAVVDHDETVNYSQLQPAFEEKDGNGPSADEGHASSPTCTCTSMSTAEDHSCVPGPHCSCFCSCQSVQQNQNENLEWLEGLGQNGTAVDPVQKSVQTEITLQLIQSWDTIVKSEDLAVFKTRHVLSELNAQSDHESQQCTDRDLPRTKVPSNSSRQRQLRKERDCRNGCSGSPLISPGPASSAVCNSTILVSENQVSLMGSESELVMSRGEQSVKTDLVESGSLILDTSYISNDDGASETTFLKENDGLDFLPVDDFLEYF